MVGRQILLVDDEPDIQGLFASCLRDEGFAVDLAATVAEATARLSARTYDLVITDWRLPDGDGRLIADWAAELGAKTIVMSGYLFYMPSGRVMGHETLTKPIRPYQFVAAVKRFIGGEAS
jgi:DNA-binding response OmpR family regulator